MKTLLTPDSVIQQLNELRETLLKTAAATDAKSARVHRDGDEKSALILLGQVAALRATANLIQANIDALNRLPENRGGGVCILTRFPRRSACAH